MTRAAVRVPAPRRAPSAPRSPRTPTPPARVPPPHPPSWISSVLAGVAVLLAATPVSAVVADTGWVPPVVGAVGLVAGIGVLGALATRVTGRRVPPVVVVLAQLVGVAGLVTALFTASGAFGVLPGPAALDEMGGLLAGAATQIDVGTAPITGSPEILFLVTAALGLLAVAVHGAAVGAGAPAAAGVPLLAAFAVPAALADDLLPWWALAAAAVGFGLLLLAPDRNRRGLPGGVALVAGATALAVGLGAVTGFVGTAGRFDGGGLGGDGAGSIGLTPFTSLRGQLLQDTPVQLFEVRGLPRGDYLRALTLSNYQSGVGWQATRPGPGVPAAGPFVPPGAPGEEVDVQISNLGFRDYWLPLYGAPLAVEGLEPGRWVYDEPGGTAYSARPEAEDGWRERAFLPTPSADQLRTAEGGDPPPAIYTNVLGIDRRITELTAQVTAGATTDFDRATAVALYFTGPDSTFTYDLRTAPPEGDDALVEFLTVGRTGYCEQFASAMAVMLRTLGIPARVAVGFTAGTAVGDYRVISTADAHAWVEAWFPGVGWTRFDPTPLADGRTIVPPYVEQALQEAGGGGTPVGQGTPAPQEQPTPTPTPAPQEQDAQQDPSAAPVDEGSGLPLWPFAVLLIVGVVLLAPSFLRTRARSERLAAAAKGGPGAAGAAWEELLAESMDRGAPAPPTDTVRAAARRLVREHHLDDPARDALREVVTAVEGSWYGERHPGPRSLVAPVAAVRTGIAAGSELGLRARLFPRSGLARARPLRRRPRASDDSAAARS